MRLVDDAVAACINQAVQQSMGYLQGLLDPASAQNIGPEGMTVND